jgi:phage terminase large subunit-like protein
VDEENSRTKYQRDKMTDWYYKVLLPTLNPPTRDDRFIGCVWVIGTRYHYEDQYGRLVKQQPDGTGGEYSGDKTLIIPIVREDGSPEWPERFSEETIASYRAGGIIRFNSQYMCNCDAMQGQIFQYDDCQVLTPEQEAAVKWDNLIIYHGVDLAIKEEEEADMFAQVIIGFGPPPEGSELKPDNVYILDYQEEHLRFAQQTKAIIAKRKLWKPVRTGVEANAYQEAQVQVLEDKKQTGIVPIYTLKDKVTRANNLEAEIFHPKKIWFKKEHEHLREVLVLFPNYRYKDLFDALDIAVATSKKRQRKKRDREPGVI